MGKVQVSLNGLGLIGAENGNHQVFFLDQRGKSPSIGGLGERESPFGRFRVRVQNGNNRLFLLD